MKKKILLRYILLFSITSALVFFDILTKILFDNVSIELIYNFLSFESTQNYGAGLGVLGGQTVLLIVLTSIFLVGFIVFDYFFKNKNKLYFISLTLILAGGIGNLIDRIFLGYVRDFIHINLPFMPYYFNLADVFLTFGVVFLIIEILFKREPKKNEDNIENRK